MKSINKFNNVFLVFGILFIGLQCFSAGVNATHHWYFSMVFDLVLAAFWAAIMWLMHQSAVLDAKMDSDMHHLDKLGELFKELADNELKPPVDHEKELSSSLMAIIDEVTGGNRPPFKKELAEIKKRFNEATGHVAELELVQGGMNVKIASDPETMKENTPKKRAPRSNPNGAMDVVKRSK